jgi:hypothetical protein
MLMNDLAMKALEPLILAVVGTLTSWVLVWLRTMIKTKTGIALNDDQFEQAKKIVQQVEEEALSGLFLGRGQAKTARAIGMLQEALPKLDVEQATTMIKQAVAVSPNIGATSQCKISAGAGAMPDYVTP